MTAKQKISMILGYLGMTQTDLAKLLGWSPQQLSQRISRGKFTLEDWETIAGVLGVTVDLVFTMQDGKKI